MTKVIAALDNSLAAKPVLTTAVALSKLFGADVEAIHVRTNGDRVVQNAADAAGLVVRTVTGPVLERLAEVGESEETAAMVLGARGTPAGRRPLGGTALALATMLPKPVIVVPPDANAAEAIRRVLVPLEARLSASLVPQAVFELVQGTDLDVIVLHVHEEASLPAFTDQPQHEQPAWAREFLRRYCPSGIGRVQLEVRFGRVEELVPLVAADTRIDLIVLGWAQELGPGRAAVVRATLERTRTPVMLVPVRVPAVTIDRRPTASSLA